MNKIEINIPEGYKIDQSKSDLSKGIIEFKPVEKKKLSYEYIARYLFSAQRTFHIKDDHIEQYTTDNKYSYNNATSKEQLECLMAYNKLRNVAVYLNKDWKPKFNCYTDNYYITFNSSNRRLVICSNMIYNSGEVYFASKELAEQAIEILGEEEIKKALFIY